MVAGKPKKLLFILKMGTCKQDSTAFWNGDLLGFKHFWTRLQIHSHIFQDLHLEELHDITHSPDSRGLRYAEVKAAQHAWLADKSGSCNSLQVSRPYWPNC